jgi:hypothetical protein
MQSQQQSLSPEVQAVLDLCEIQGVPVKFENSVYTIEKIAPWDNTPLRVSTANNDVNTLHPLSKPMSTQNMNTVLRWIDEWKLWNPK